MTAPVIVSRATGGTSSDSTLHPINIPAGNLGDVLIVIFASDGATTVTVDSGAGWTKLGQLQQGAGAVTCAVFWKRATGVGADAWFLRQSSGFNTWSARSGAEQLTLATSVAEQSSHITLRVAGPTQVDGASASGDGINSDPPNLTLPLAVEALWVAVRAGDGTVVATAAPTGFTNLQTVTGATAGASLNSAELTQTIDAFNPTVFNSLTEQWVAWTIAAYSQQVAKTLSPQYNVIARVPQVFSAAYAILAESLWGDVWFPRLTSGYNTWASYGAAAQQVETSLSPRYQVAGGVQAPFSFVYRLGEATTPASESWFPRLTDGFATWAGEGAAYGTGSIDGGGVFPSIVLQSYSAAYLVNMQALQMRAVQYQVYARISSSFSTEYAVNGSVSALYLVNYDVITPATQELAVTYEVFGIIGSVGNSLSLTYSILAPVSQDLVVSYEVQNVEPVEQSFSMSYEVTQEITLEFSVQYSTALTSVEQSFDEEYGIDTSVLVTLPVWYEIVNVPEMVFSAEYNVGLVLPGNKVVDVYRYGSAEVKR